MDGDEYEVWDEDAAALEELEAADGVDAAGETEAAAGDAAGGAYGYVAYDEADLLRSAAARAPADEDEDASDDGDGDGELWDAAEASRRVEAIAGGTAPADSYLEFQRREQAGDSPAASSEDDEAREPPAKRGRGGGGAFGATADDIWGATAPGARRRARNRERRRARNAKRGARTREPPLEAREKVAHAHAAIIAGDLDAATELLKEAVRLAPNFADPYETLGTVAAEAGDPVRAMNYYMIAVHMAGDDGKWRRLAKLSADHGLLRQAVYCLTKLLARCRDDLDAHWDRSVMYAQVGEARLALKGFQRLARARPDDGGVVKWLARVHHQLRDPAAAASVLETLMRDHPASVDLTHVNMLAELQVAAGDWAAAAALVERARAGEALAAGAGGPGGALPADLEVKAAMAAAGLGRVGDARARLAACLADDDAAPDLLEAGGDLMLDHGHPDDALQYYMRALASGGASASAWDRLGAAAQRARGDGGEAACLADLLSPGSAVPSGVAAEAALRLCELMVRQGEHERAADLLASTADADGGGGGSPCAQGAPADDAEDAARASRAARRADLLLELGDAASYLAAALPTAVAALDRAERAADLRASLDPRVRKALARYHGRGGAAGGGGGPGGGLAALAADAGDAAAVFKGYEGRDRRKPHVREADEAAAGLVAAVDDDAAAAAAGKGDPLDAAGFRAAARAAHALLAVGRVAEADAVLDRLARFARRPRKADERADALALLQAAACLTKGEAAKALALLRDVCGRRPAHNGAWNAYCRAVAAAGAARAGVRWLATAVDAQPGALAPLILLGAACAGSGEPVRGVTHLAAARAAAPAEPLPALCLGVALASLAASKQAPDRDRCCAAALAHLLDYARYRQNPQEAAYNVGRVCQGLGLAAHAAAWYGRALAAGAPPGAPPGTCVAREAAHNLALILRSSGADDLARRVLRRYATV